MTTGGLCEATRVPFPGAGGCPLRCDRPAGHGGSFHTERWVARWRRDGSDLRWFVEQDRRYTAGDILDPRVTAVGR